MTLWSWSAQHFVGRGCTVCPLLWARLACGGSVMYKHSEHSLNIPKDFPNVYSMVGVNQHSSLLCFFWLILYNVNDGHFVSGDCKICLLFSILIGDQFCSTCIVGCKWMTDLVTIQTDGFNTVQYFEPDQLWAVQLNVFLFLFVLLLFLCDLLSGCHSYVEATWC